MGPVGPNDRPYLIFSCLLGEYYVRYIISLLIKEGPEGLNGNWYILACFRRTMYAK